MLKKYHHVIYELRCQIYILEDKGNSSAAISRALNVHKSTISGEFKRNTDKSSCCYQKTREMATKGPLNGPLNLLCTSKFKGPFSRAKKHI